MSDTTHTHTHTPHAHTHTLSMWGNLSNHLDCKASMSVFQNLLGPRQCLLVVSSQNAMYNLYWGQWNHFSQWTIFTNSIEISFHLTLLTAPHIVPLIHVIYFHMFTLQSFQQRLKWKSWTLSQNISSIFLRKSDTFWGLFFPESSLKSKGNSTDLTGQKEKFT